MSRVQVRMSMWDARRPAVGDAEVAEVHRRLRRQAVANGGAIGQDSAGQLTEPQPRERDLIDI
jgi:hypothetical protein